MPPLIRRHLTDEESCDNITKMNYLPIIERMTAVMNDQNEAIQKLEDMVNNLETRLSEVEDKQHVLDRTIYGVQELFKKAGEYRGRPKGGFNKLPKGK